MRKVCFYTHSEELKSKFTSLNFSAQKDYGSQNLYYTNADEGITNVQECDATMLNRIDVAGTKSQSELLNHYGREVIGLVRLYLTSNQI